MKPTAPPGAAAPLVAPAPLAAPASLADPAAAAVSAWLDALGAPPDDPELARTPERVARLWRENLLCGQGADAADLLGETLPDPGGGLVVVTDLPFLCICPHHLLPAVGVAHLAYESGGQIVGFGALERLVATLGRQLILQETLTGQLADALMTHLAARGAAVQLEASHLCLALQGREPRGARIHTRAQRGTLIGRTDVLPAVTRGAP